jgi:hypothetical protein
MNILHEDLHAFLRAARELVIFIGATDVERKRCRKLGEKRTHRAQIPLFSLFHV